MTPNQIDLAIVIPVFNEEENILPLYQMLTDALVPLRLDYEIIFVNDGSTDGSYEALCRVAALDQKAKVINLRRNFGQTAAMTAGFDYARGRVIIPMDGDLQNDPADIPRLLAKVEEGYDIVSGWRKDRQDKEMIRKLASRLANWLTARMTGVALHDTGCTLKAYRSEILKTTRLYGEMHRFIPALASWSGAKVTECVVNHRPRTAGKAKYGLERTLKVVLDLITIKFLGSFSTKPIYIFGGLGVVSAGAAFLFGLAVLYQKFFSDFPMNRNPLLLLTAVLMITTVQFILMGLLAELLVRTYHESQNRPTYVIKEVLETSDCGSQISDCGLKKPSSAGPRSGTGDKE
jgi:glycosyltransferase involved in cell wall biosynthesis